MQMHEAGLILIRERYQILGKKLYENPLFILFFLKFQIMKGFTLEIESFYNNNKELIDNLK